MRTDSYPSDSAYYNSRDVAEKALSGTIDRVVVEEVKDRNGVVKKKWVCYFRDLPKKLVMKPVTIGQVDMILGTKDTDDWVGGKVELFHTTCQMGSGRTNCLRIRSPQSVDATPVSDEPVVDEDGVPFNRPQI